MSNICPKRQAVINAALRSIFNIMFFWLSACAGLTLVENSTSFKLRL